MKILSHRVRSHALHTAAIAAVVSLGACASSNDASLIHLPDGQTGYAVNCSGADASSTWASCYVLAGDKCGATGYTIVSKDNEEGECKKPLDDHTLQLRFAPLAPLSENSMRADLRKHVQHDDARYDQAHADHGGQVGNLLE